MTLPRLLAGISALAVFAGCSSGESRELMLSATPGSGEAEVVVDIDGEVETERITEPWSRTVEVDGEFSVVVTVTDLDGGDDASCRIVLDQVAPIDASDGGEARCQLAGSVSGGNADVSGRGEASAGPTTVPDTSNDDAVVGTIEVLDGAVSMDLPAGWQIADDEGFQPGRASGIQEPRAFTADDTVVMVRAAGPDESVVEVVRVEFGMLVDGSLAEIGEMLRSDINPNGVGSEQAFGPVDFAGFEAFEYALEVDGRTIDWNLLRSGPHLLAVVGVDRGAGEVADVLASVGLQTELFPAVPDWTRVAIGASGEPSVAIEVPADVVLDEDGWLISERFGVFAQLSVDRAPPILNGIREELADLGVTETVVEIGEFEATVFDGEADGRPFRRVVVPADGLLIDIVFNVGPDDETLLDEMFDRVSVVRRR